MEGVRSMSNRTATLWLVAGILAGYLLAGPAAKAQSSSVLAPSFVAGAVGQELVLQFERGTLSESTTSMRCSVRTVEGTWVNCAIPDAFDSDRGQKWVNLAYVTQITRRDK
jgi:hypothetical protein